MTEAHPAEKPAAVAHGPRLVDVGEHCGQRVDNFLVKVLKDLPKSRIYRMIRKGEVRVNGGRVRPTYRLKAGDQVRIPPHRARAAGEPPFIGDRQLGSLEDAILFEDRRLLVLNKPAGLAVHGGSGVSFGVIEALRRLRPREDLELVHRLDRDTSGCLLVAKKRSLLRDLHEQLRAGALIKSYCLIVHGKWQSSSTVIETPLTRFLTASGERRVRVDPAGKPSRTEFQVAAEGDGATLLNATLHTGRTHQIRVHAQSAGHSILGDEKYASAVELEADRALGVRRLCLHAGYVAIPTEEGLQEFESPLPADFSSIWSKFQR